MLSTLLAALLSTALVAPWPAFAAPPKEGDCPTVSGGPTGAGGEGRDAAAVTLREGMVLRGDDLLILRQLVPKEIWSHREVFFSEGMRMTIGPCFRRYPQPGFFTQATQAHVAPQSHQENC